MWQHQSVSEWKCCGSSESSNQSVLFYYWQLGRGDARGLVWRFFTAKVWVPPQASPRGIYGGLNGTGTGFSSVLPSVSCFSPSTSVFPCQYHSTIAPYSFIPLPPTLYNVFLPVLQFSPVSIIPPLLHTHSFIYHSRFTIFFSQYFSFPLSVSFHHCSILIHSSTTHAV